MTKAGKKIVSWIVFLVSMVSFIPVEFTMNLIEAHAAMDVSAACNVVVSEGMNGNTDLTGSGTLYKTTNEISNIYLVAPDKRVEESDLTSIGDEGIISQKVKILSINGLREANWADMGVSISEARLDKKVGLRIENLPLGVNKIEYTVELTTAKRIEDPNFVPAEGIEDRGIIKRTTLTPGEYPIITIEHGNSIVQNQIDSIEFSNYIGGNEVDDDVNINVTPFRYDKTVRTASDSSLRYVNDIPVSVKRLQYTLNIAKNMFDYGEDKMYINGEQTTDLTVGETSDGLYNTISGNLQKTGQSTMIVLAVRNTQSIKRSFSIEIQYGNKKSEDDYTLRDIGITKYNFNSDSNVKAQIGKTFIETTGTGNDEGIPIYTSTLKVDSLAKMISMEPTIGRSAANTAYKIYNQYDGGIEPGQLKNGKMYVDFNKGNNNTLILEVYEGKDGSITGKKLAIYKFKVEALNDESSDVKFVFENAKLTQPGRPEGENIDFTSSRRSYDLYSNEDIINFALENPYSSARNEYVKAWTCDSVSTDNAKLLDENSITHVGNSYEVKVGEAKKLILQAYYDQVTYKTNSDGSFVYKDGEKVVESTKSYAIGDKYTFYIASNADVPDNNDPSNNVESDNASLTNIKVKNASIKPVNGDGSGFVSSENSYEATVSKDSTEANITVTCASEKVKDITAKVVETRDEYGLYNKEGLSIPLNSSGRTTIEIVVTAEDGVTKKTYSLTINNDTRNNSAELKNIILDKGDLIFDASKSINKARVDLNVNKVKVTPVLSASGAKVTVNDEEFTGSAIQVSLAGEQKTKVTIEVTAEDGSESKTYVLEIYRTDSVIDDNDDDDSNSDSDLFYDEINDCWVDTTKYDEWGKVKGKSVYFNKKGRQLKNAWITSNGKSYYLNNKGYKSSGWVSETGGKMYYLDPVNGEMRTGWICINDKWYYLNLNGVMQTYWLNLNNKWYYFTTSGELIRNTTMYIDDQMYTFGADGAIC